VIIIDASVAVKWVVPEDGTEAATKLLNEEDLAAPALWLAEAANALWTKATRGEASADEARERAQVLASAPVASIALPLLLPVAVSLALELRHPIYDCFYLSAALQRDTYVCTADRRFAEKVTAHSHIAERTKLLGG
jgi:predicted nucleic acid-binding protein